MSEAGLCSCIVIKIVQAIISIGQTCMDAQVSNFNVVPARNRSSYSLNPFNGQLGGYERE